MSLRLREVAARFRRIRWRYGAFGVAVSLALLLGALPLGSAWAEELVFDPNPQSPTGAKLEYTVGGAVLQAPDDHLGTSRTHDGTVTTGSTVTLSGLASVARGTATLDGSFQVYTPGAGLQPGADKTETVKLKKEEDAGAWSQPFSMTVAIPGSLPEGSYIKYWVALIGRAEDSDSDDRAEVSGTLRLKAGPPVAAAQPTVRPTASPTPAARLVGFASQGFLPPDGQTQSQVTFTWLDGDKPVSGKTITFGWQGEGILDKPSAVTDADGNATVTYTPPKRAGKPGEKVAVFGKGEGVGEARVDLFVGPVGVEFPDIQSRADRGGDHVYLRAVLRSYHGADLRDVPVEFYDGDPAKGGKLLGRHRISRLPAGGTALSAQYVNELILWELGGKAERRQLFIRIPTVAGLDAKGPVFEQSYTISNYGAPFKTNADAYSFANYGRQAGSVEWLEDALAITAANEKLSEGVRVLSYPTLVQDFAETYGKASVGGHCLGMATSAVAYFLDPAARPASGPTYGYTQSDPKVRGNIALYHVYQTTTRFREALPLGGSQAPEPGRLTELRARAASELGAGRPIVLSMSGPNGGHAVVAYQLVTVEETGNSLFMLYDNNRPFGQLAAGYAPAALLWPAAGVFRYDDYDRVRLAATPRLPASAGATFAGLAKTFAGQMMSELTGGLSPLRLITFRGAAEPVVSTPDGKRLGFVDGKPIAELPGAKVVKVLDTYIFTVPAGLDVKLTAKATAEGTLTVGVATPDGARSDVGRLVGLARPDPRALAAPGSAAVQLFEKVRAGKNASVELSVKGSQVTFSVGGTAVSPTGRESFAGSAVAQPTPAPAAPPTTATGGPVAKPTWRDPLDGKADSGLASVSGPSANGKPAASGVSWVAGAAGQAASLSGDSAYVGYDGSRLKADQGTILFRYRPIADLAGAYAKRHDGWTDSGQNKPPQYGFLVDTIGWNGAPKGAFEAMLNPAAKGGITWGVWDGKKWHYATWTTPDGWQWDASRWYEIGLTWGPKGLSVLVDGERRAAIPDVAQINNTIPWFLGQGPWYWPYGPHSLLGSYDDLRVYAEQLEPYAGSTGAAAAVGQATGPAGGSSVLPGGPGSASELALKGPTFLGGNPLPKGTASAMAAASVANGSSGPGGADGALGSLAAKLPRSVAEPVAEVADKLDSLDLVGVLPGGSTGTAAATVDKLPGGTAVLCGWPILLGAVLFLLLLGLLTIRGRRRAAPRDLGYRSTRGARTGRRVSARPAPPNESDYPAAVAVAEPIAETRFCERCGGRLGPSARFCGKCGAQVEQ